MSKVTGLGRMQGEDEPQQEVHRGGGAVTVIILVVVVITAVLYAMGLIPSLF